MIHRYLSNVTTLAIDEERCIGCGRCVDVCPHRIIAMTNGKAAVNDKDRCIECGACSKNCPVGAITVTAGVGCAAAILSSKSGATVCGSGGCGGKTGCC
jgi:ferredoxin